MLRSQSYRRRGSTCRRGASSATALAHGQSSRTSTTTNTSVKFRSDDVGEDRTLGTVQRRVVMETQIVVVMTIVFVQILTTLGSTRRIVVVILEVDTTSTANSIGGLCLHRRGGVGAGRCGCRNTLRRIKVIDQQTRASSITTSSSTGRSIVALFPARFGQGVSRLIWSINGIRIRRKAINGTVTSAGITEKRR